MLCKLSKIIFILFIFYLGWFLNVFFIIPRMPLILGLSMIALLVLYNLHPLRRHSIIITRPVLIWLVFSFYALLSGVFISYNKNHLIDSLFTYVQILAMMVYIINVSIIEKDYKFFVKSYLFYSIIYMITMLLWGVEIKGRLTLSVTSNPNGDALTLVYGIFCVLFLCDFKKITHVILSFLLTGIFIYTIMLTGSRKSFLAAVLLLLCWFIFTFKGYQRIFSTKKKIFTLFITIILIITIIYKLQPFFVNSSLYWRLSERGFLISNDKARSGMYIEALKFFYDNPLFGIGFNHYRL